VTELPSFRAYRDIPAFHLCYLTLKAQKPKFAAYPSPLNTLGDRLRARRLDLGLVQKEVAARIGVTVSTILNWERNRSDPSLRFPPNTYDFLGYNPSDESVLKSLGRTFERSPTASRFVPQETGRAA
jgi:DNA-binding XRE family transcriptional regulator